MGTRFFATMPSIWPENAARGLPNSTYIRRENGSLALQLVTLGVQELQDLIHQKVVVTTNADVEKLQAAGFLDVREAA